MMKDEQKKPMPKVAIPSFAIQPRANVNVGGSKSPTTLVGEVKKPKQ